MHILNKIKVLMRDVEWNVAIRPHNDLKIEEQSEQTFFVLKNTWRYWCADPFVFEKDGTTYIFMEIYDRITQRGEIGYRVWKNGKVSKIYKCMKSEHHFSYPYVYSEGETVYMLPECYQSGKLIRYKATHFPDKWEKDEIFIEDASLCDTDIVNSNKGQFLLTTEVYGEPFRYDRLFLYVHNGDKWVKTTDEPVVSGLDKARNGGAVFENFGRFIRPAQNCEDSYGSALRFFEINVISENEYKETEICSVEAKNVKLKNMSNCFDGIHTYNTNGKYDVIDLRRENVFQSARFVYLLRCRLKKMRRK